MSFFDDNMAGPNFRNGSAKDKNGLVIQFYHVPTIHKSLENSNFLSHATFKAFLTAFTDSFKTNWNEKETLGRMDSIQTFKNTKRTVSLSFDVPASSEVEALENFYELEKLIMMQYPVYEKIDISKITTISSDKPSNEQSPTNGRIEKDLDSAVKANSDNSILTNTQKTTGRFMSSPPLIYVKFKNWLGNSLNYNAEKDVSDSLVVVMAGVDFKPDLDSGTFINNGFLIPMLFSVDLTMTVVHTSELGWSKDKSEQYLFGEARDSEVDPQTKKYPSFPYNTGTTLVDE